MGNLYNVSVNIETCFDVYVEAGSEDEAEVIAEDSYDLSDVDFDTWARARIMSKCPLEIENEIVEGSGGRTCAQVFNGVDTKEYLQRKMEEYWPKLPGFEESSEKTDGQKMVEFCDRMMGCDPRTECTRTLPKKRS